MTADDGAVAAVGSQPKRVLRVAEVTRYVKQVLENEELLTLVQVQGEVTNLSRPGSGIVYFSLKDSFSQLPCVMMRSEALGHAAEMSALGNGVSVLVEGSITVYEQRGYYQLNVRRIRVGGVGAARVRFERLREKLEGEGLFAAARKRPLPPYPRKLILVTAPKSQAYYDVIKRLELQWPSVTVITAGVSVQGDHASGQIATAIDLANRLTDADLIVLVRGGGSPEELDAFNDERLARTIFASRIPVLTGIGHTQDWTIADLVADAHAQTPTAAAGLAVPDGRAMVNACRQVYRSIRAHMGQGLKARAERLGRAEAALLAASPRRRIDARRQRLDDLWDGMEKMLTADLRVRRRRLESVHRQMEALNPMAILARGYALLTDLESGSVVFSTADATPGRRLNARVKDGSFPVTVGPS